MGPGVSGGTMGPHPSWVSTGGALSPQMAAARGLDQSAPPTGAGGQDMTCGGGGSPGGDGGGCLPSGLGDVGGPHQQQQHQQAGGAMLPGVEGRKISPMDIQLVSTLCCSGEGGSPQTTLLPLGTPHAYGVSTDAPIFPTLPSSPPSPSPGPEPHRALPPAVHEQARGGLHAARAGQDRARIHHAGCGGGGGGGQFSSSTPGVASRGSLRGFVQLRSASRA